MTVANGDPDPGLFRQCAASEESAQVECLGLTFESEEARRDGQTEPPKRDKSIEEQERKHEEMKRADAVQNIYSFLNALKGSRHRYDVWNKNALADTFGSDVGRLNGNTRIIFSSRYSDLISLARSPYPSKLIETLAA